LFRQGAKLWSFLKQCLRELFCVERLQVVRLFAEPEILPAFTKTSPTIGLGDVAP
jgi:hypothetical protein